MAQNHYSIPQLEKQLDFSLYACSREVIKRYRPHLDALGLTYTQYIILMVIWQETMVSVRDLGRQLYLDSGTLTPVLKTLERNGFITRHRSTEDERVLLVTITDEGLKLREKALELPAIMADQLGLEPDEAAALQDLLQKVLHKCTEE